MNLSDMNIIEEPAKLDYCPELREMWSQFDATSRIEWLNDKYSVGYVRLGDINIARVSFWEEGVDYGYKVLTNRTELTEEQIADNRLRDTYYYGYKVEILNLRTGEAINEKHNLLYKLDFGRDVYLHKATWLWYNEMEELIDINENGVFNDLLKKAGKLMKYIEVWCK